MVRAPSPVTSPTPIVPAPHPTCRRIAGKAAGAGSRAPAARRRDGDRRARGAAHRPGDRAASRRRRPGAGAIAVTGTNGKTTTSLMLSRIATAAGLRPLHNRSGSNLMRGVAAMLVEEASLGGAIPDAARRLAILEVDEATLPEIVARSRAARDRVHEPLPRPARPLRRGRYGARRRGSGRSPQQRAVTPTLVLNADDPAVAHLGRDAARARAVLRHRRYDRAAASGDDHASDFRTCLQLRRRAGVRPSRSTGTSATGAAQRAATRARRRMCGSRASCWATTRRR